MATVLSKDQKRKVSIHGGHVIDTYFPDGLPMWTDIGTDVLQNLLELLVEELREKKCNDVADHVETHPDEAKRALQIRFKSLKDRKRRQAKGVT